MKNSIKTAFGGMMVALSVALMFFTGLVPVATIAIPAIAGCLTIPVVAHINSKWGLGVFAATALLCFFLTPDREAFLIYVLFFGYYPSLYGYLRRIKSKVLKVLVKLLIFTLAITAEGLISIYVLGIPLEAIGFLGALTPLYLLILADLLLLLYDYTLDGLIGFYISKFYHKINGVFKLR